MALLAAATLAALLALRPSSDASSTAGPVLVRRPDALPVIVVTATPIHTAHEKDAGGR